MVQMLKAERKSIKSLRPDQLNAETMADRPPSMAQFYVSSNLDLHKCRESKETGLSAP
jgi:hypothetical protein